jgi:Uma2 family endonuclease
MGTTSAPLTFEEFERIPDQPGKQELLRGELIEEPPAKKRHKQIAHRIYDRLAPAVRAAHARGEAQELGEVFHEMGYKLADHSWVQSDVSITHQGHPGDDYFEGAPAIAIEIVSPSNTADQLSTKTRLYFEYCAREVWRVYQKARYAEVHVAGSSREVMFDEALTTPLLPGFSMSVKEILGES